MTGYLTREERIKKLEEVKARVEVDLLLEKAVNPDDPKHHALFVLTTILRYPDLVVNLSDDDKVAILIMAKVAMFEAARSVPQAGLVIAQASLILTKLIDNYWSDDKKDG